MTMSFNEELAHMRLAALSAIRQALRADDAFAKVCGHKSRDAYLRSTCEHQLAYIDKAILKFEKENPR